MQVAKPQIVGENEVADDMVVGDDNEDFWHTSIGKFRFSLDDLPQSLQYIHQLLKVSENNNDCRKFIFF